MSSNERCPEYQSRSSCNINESLCRNARVGYAFVPFQRLNKVYTPTKALREGTIFPELNLTIEQYERGLYNGK